MGGGVFGQVLFELFDDRDRREFGDSTISFSRVVMFSFGELFDLKGAFVFGVWAEGVDSGFGVGFRLACGECFWPGEKFNIEGFGLNGTDS